MKIGIGVQNESNSELSGRRAAEAAIRNGHADRADLVLAFCGGQLDAFLFMKGVRSAVGDASLIIGGSAVGIISNSFLSYTDYPAGVAVIQSDSLHCRVAAVGDLDKDEKTAGIALARQLPHHAKEKLLLLFYDSIKQSATETSPPIMNASPPLIAGLESALLRNIPIIGAGLMGDYQFRSTVQFCGDYPGTQCAVGALLSGDFHYYVTIMHGFTPLDGIYHTITRMDGGVIYDVDQTPVVQMIDERYGDKEWRQQFPVRRLAVGVNMGDKYEDFLESNYINRLISGILPDESGIVLFEPDLQEGMEIQFMTRNSTNRIFESVKNNSLQLMRQIIADGRKPMLGLYIDCAGRTASFSDTLTEEASEVVNVFNQYDTALLGFYSGVEIAPFIGKSKGLDWTGVLLVIADD